MTDTGKVNIALDAIALAKLSADHADTLAAEVQRLRRILWECWAASGADTGLSAPDDPPGVHVPDIPELALEGVRDLRRDYSEGQAELVADLAAIRDYAGRLDDEGDPAGMGILNILDRGEGHD